MTKEKEIENNREYLKSLLKKKNIIVYRYESFSDIHDAKKRVSKIKEKGYAGEHWSMVSDAPIMDEEGQGYGRTFVRIEGETLPEDVDVKCSKQYWKIYPEEAEICLLKHPKIRNVEIESPKSVRSD